MTLFYVFNDKKMNLSKPEIYVKKEFSEIFKKSELRPFLRSEICVLDMLLAVTQMNDGYYKERLVLKGGHSVRNLVPLRDHRFSFDADFNANSAEGFTYGDVSKLKQDLYRFGQGRGCTTRTKVTQDNPMLYFLEVGYHEVLNKGLSIGEHPKIEVCKQCRTQEKPILSRMNTMIDLELLGIEPPELLHLDLEEQLANKLYVIGARGRQRNHFDAYDAYRICKNNKIDWKKEKRIFTNVIKKTRKPVSEYSSECMAHLDAIKRNGNKRASFQNIVFDNGSLEFDRLIDDVKLLYQFNGW